MKNSYDLQRIFVARLTFPTPNALALMLLFFQHSSHQVNFECLINNKRRVRLNVETFRKLYSFGVDPNLCAVFSVQYLCSRWFNLSIAIVNWQLSTNTSTRYLCSSEYYTVYRLLCR